MNTTVVNFFAGPGAGKSTNAADLFSRLKRAGVVCEYVSEYAKDIVWEETDALLQNQLHVFSEQFRRQNRLKGKVQFIITDSPLPLASIYFDHFQNRVELWKMHSIEYSKAFHELVEQSFREFDNLNVFVNRTKEFSDIGRKHGETESIRLDNTIKSMLLSKYSIDLIVGSENGSTVVFEYLRRKGLFV